MKYSTLTYAFVTTLATLSTLSHAEDKKNLISEREAISAALAELSVEVLGIRFDEPDSQWDVFIRSGKKAFEIEVDAASGDIVAAEEESLQEIQAELSGDLSHEGTSGDVD